MSADAVNEAACSVTADTENTEDTNGVKNEKAKKKRRVYFPEDNQLVAKYFEPANPWHDLPTTTREQLALEYLDSCRRHCTPPIETVVEQIKELPENVIGGATRACRLLLSSCLLLGPAAVDALEALLRKVQFRRVAVENCAIDDEGAEALFDMIEYYESAASLALNGPRDFAVRGWQAASRMIKKSAELSELEASDWPLEASHAAVLSRSLKPHTCRLTSLCIQRAGLAGEPLLSLIIALKSNSSVRELRLGDNSLTSTDALQLAALLRANARLHTLDLSNNMIQDAGVGHIADALVAQAAQTPPSAGSSPCSPLHCPVDGYEQRGLAFLILWNNQLTRNCGQHLSRALRASSSLCVLNIGRNALGADLLNCLRPAPASLGLQGARLGPDAAKSLSALLMQGRSLQRLDLRDNRLGVEGLQSLLNAMQENTTLTQIDLDDYEEPTTLSADNSDAATCARLTKSILALCRRNEPPTSDRAAHRKISLTCHTLSRPTCDPAPRRLRSPLPSPAPSPAGSPVPGAAPHSRFSVTRVTPERETPGECSIPAVTAPSRPPASRFRVQQVSEPPQPPTPAAQRRAASRFSVTRNYDTVYNPVRREKVTEKGEKVTEKHKQVTETEKVTLSSDVRQVGSTVQDDNPIVIIDKCQSDKCKDNDRLMSDVDTKSDNKSNMYTDKTEEILHNAMLTSKGDEHVLITETKLVKNTTEVSESEKLDMKVEVTMTKESAVKENTKVQTEQRNEPEVKENVAMKQIVAITEDLGNLIQEMKELSTKTSVLTKKSDDGKSLPVNINVVLKKNRSESSLDSPDLEVSRLMKKTEAFCDSSSSLEVSGSSMESLNTELDRRKVIEINTNLLNTSTSSNESVSPVFDKKNESISSLEASMSSVDSRNDKQMLTSADSGIEYSIKKEESTLQNIIGVSNEETLTNSPKRTSSSVDIQKRPERTRKISWVAPSSSFQVQKETVVEAKLPTNLEKLLSLFQHPSSFFSRTEDERKTSTPPRKESANLASSFWSWGGQSSEKEDFEEDSTLSERVQVSYVDESFSKKLDSKTPSTDTDNTLSEFHSLPILGNSESDVDDDVTIIKTTDTVQSLDVESNVNSKCDSIDLNDVNKNVCDLVRPRSFAAVLKASASENSMKQSSPDNESVDKLPSKVIRGIKENISPENTLTSATKSLALELYETEKHPVTSVWEENEVKKEQNLSIDSGTSSDEVRLPIETVDLAKDALVYLEDFEPNVPENVTVEKEVSLSEELRDAELKEMLDLSPELVIDELTPEVFKEKCLRASPIIPAKLKKSNSLEALPGILETKADSPKKKIIVFDLPETSTPRDIPRPRKLRSRSGSSPKSLPESFKHSSLSKIEHTLTKKKKRVSSLGKIAKDSLLALNMTEDEIADFRRSYKLTSVESLKSLESVSEDANSQSGNSEAKCRCMRMSQESLMSLDSISEDCKCEKGEGR